MPLVEEINAELIKAMKAKDATRVACLRLVVAAFKNRAIEKRGELDDSECIKVLSTLAKQRGESIEMFKQGGRTDLADKETAELAIVQSFLPAALSEAEIRKIVEEVIAEVGAAGPEDMGKVMKAIGPRVAGRANGKIVSDAVKTRLNQS